MKRKVDQNSHMTRGNEIVHVSKATPKGSHPRTEGIALGVHEHSSSNATLKGLDTRYESRTVGSRYLTPSGFDTLVSSGYVGVLPRLNISYSLGVMSHRVGSNRATPKGSNILSERTVLGVHISYTKSTTPKGSNTLTECVALGTYEHSKRTTTLKGLDKERRISYASILS